MQELLTILYWFLSQMYLLLANRETLIAVRTFTIENIVQETSLTRVY